MAASEEFKQAIKAGKLIEALKTALSESIELKITTWVSLADPYGSNQEQPSEALPGYRMHSRINIVDGEIETEVGNHFVGNSAFTELREFHIHQIKSSRQIFQRNLTSLQQMFAVMAQMQQAQWEATLSQIEPSPQIAPPPALVTTSQSQLPPTPETTTVDKDKRTISEPLTSSEATTLDLSEQESAPPPSPASPLDREAEEEAEDEVLAALNVNPSTDRFVEDIPGQELNNTFDINETIIPDLEGNTAAAAAIAAAAAAAAAANSDQEELSEQIDLGESLASEATEARDEEAEILGAFEEDDLELETEETPEVLTTPTAIDSEEAEILGAFDAEQESESFWDESPIMESTDSDQMLEETLTSDSVEEEILEEFSEESSILGNRAAPEDSTFVEETDSSAREEAAASLESDQSWEEIPASESQEEEMLGAFEEEPLTLDEEETIEDSTFSAELEGGDRAEAIAQVDSDQSWEETLGTDLGEEEIIGAFEEEPLILEEEEILEDSTLAAELESGDRVEANVQVDSDQSWGETLASDSEDEEIMGVFDMEEESESLWDEPQPTEATEATSENAEESQLVDPFGDLSEEMVTSEEDDAEILSAFEESEPQATEATIAASQQWDEPSVDAGEILGMEEQQEEEEEAEILETFDTDEDAVFSWEESQGTEAPSPATTDSNEDRLVDPFDDSSTLASLDEDDVDLMSAFDPDIEAPQLDEPQPYPGTTAADLGLENGEMLEEVGDRELAESFSVENADSPEYDDSDPLAALLSEEVSQESQRSPTLEETTDFGEDDESDDPLAALFAEETVESEDPFGEIEEDSTDNEDDSELLEAFNSDDPFDIELAPPEQQRQQPPRSDRASN